MGKLPDNGTLRELLERHTQAELAAMYGVTHQAVSYRAKRLGMNARPEQNGAETREAVFEAIVRFKEQHDGCSPTYRELSEMLGRRAWSGIKYHVDALAADGRLSILPGSRGICVEGGSWSLGGELGIGEGLGEA